MFSIKKCSLSFMITASLIVLGGCTNPKDTPPPKITADEGRIYFFSKVRPGVNILSTDLNKKLQTVTTGKGSRDIDMSLNKEGYLAFTSSRVLPEDRAKRAKMGRNDRHQDINTYLLQPGKNESEGKYLAQHFGKTDHSEAMAGISNDSNWISHSRTIRPPKASQGTEKAQPYDEVHVQNRKDGTSQTVLTDDMVVKADWGPTKPELIIAHYSNSSKTASISLYNAVSQKLTNILSNPIEGAQIDAPKWSPDASKIAFIAHIKNAAAKTNKKSAYFRALYIYDLTSKSLTLASAEDTLVQAPFSWSKDSKEITYSSFDDYARVWSDELRKKVYMGGGYIYTTNLKGEYKKIAGADKERHTRPVFSPSNELIAYMYSDAFPGKKSSLRVIDRKGKLIDTLYDNVLGTGYLIWQ